MLCGAGPRKNRRGRGRFGFPIGASRRGYPRYFPRWGKTRCGAQKPLQHSARRYLLYLPYLFLGVSRGSEPGGLAGIGHTPPPKNTKTPCKRFKRCGRYRKSLCCKGFCAHTSKSRYPLKGPEVPGSKRRLPSGFRVRHRFQRPPRLVSPLDLLLQQLGKLVSTGC